MNLSTGLELNIADLFLALISGLLTVIGYFLYNSRNEQKEFNEKMSQRVENTVSKDDCDDHQSKCPFVVTDVRGVLADHRKYIFEHSHTGLDKDSHVFVPSGKGQ